MKSFILVCVSMFVGLSSADSVLYPRGCIYINGRCSEECPEGTHAYALGCGHKTPEPTCAEPNPVQERGTLCDYSACYCDPPTVRDEKTNKCVLIEECSPHYVPTVTLLPPLEDPTSISTEAPATPIKPDAPVAPEASAKPDAPTAPEAPAKPDAPAAVKEPAPVVEASPTTEKPEEKKE